MAQTDITIQAFTAIKTGVPLRSPFMFGNQEVRHLPLVHIAATVSTRGGTRATGWAAEFESPWFDKTPTRSWSAKEAVLDDCVALAAAAYRDAGRRPAGPMRIWHQAHGALEGSPPDGVPALAVQFGSSLCERAMLDAFGQAVDASCYDLLDQELLGLGPGEVHRQLADVPLSSALAEQPLPALRVRHTVGLTDPLEPDEVPAGTRPDGLPHCLRDFIKRYGLTHFKLKIGRSVEEDAARLQRIARLLNGLVSHRYWVSLDANEQYGDLEEVHALWDALRDRQRFGPFRQRVLYLEQPLPREEFARWEDVSAVSRRVPVIIDEADDRVDRFAEAVARGWSGTSLKTCKGIFKSLLNACLAHRLDGSEGRQLLLTGEDLTCPPVLSLHHYLRLASVLGLSHLEANSFHYVPNPARYLPADHVAEALRRHPELYREDPRGGTVQRVREGHYLVASLRGPGLGATVSMPAPETVAAGPRSQVMPL